MRMRRKINSRKLKQNLFLASILAYPLLLFVVFYIGVNINSILLAFKKYDFIGNWEWIGFNNFEIFIKGLFGASEQISVGFLNSVKIWAINLVICMPLYIFFSYILFKKCFMHKAIRAIVMIPSIISGFILCLVFKKFVEGSIPAIAKLIFKIEDFPNLLQNPDSALGTIIFYMIWSSFSTSLIVYPNAMNQVDKEIYESAALDGVGNMFQELRYIILPLIYPTLSTFIITGFAAILADPGPVPIFYMTSAPIKAGNMGYYYWVQIQNSDYAGYPQLAAGGLLMTCLVAPLTLLLKSVLEKLGPEEEF